MIKRKLQGEVHERIHRELQKEHQRPFQDLPHPRLVFAKRTRTGRPRSPKSPAASALSALRPSRAACTPLPLLGGPLLDAGHLGGGAIYEKARGEITPSPGHRRFAGPGLLAFAAIHAAGALIDHGITVAGAAIKAANPRISTVKAAGMMKSKGRFRKPSRPWPSRQNSAAPRCALCRSRPNSQNQRARAPVVRDPAARP